MPELHVEKGGSEKNRLTRITNLEDVAFALRVPPKAIMKYFCIERGVSSEDNILKGKHSSERIRKTLDS